MSVGTQSVVVLGGGFGGTAVARSLSTKLDPKKYTLTLISSRPFFIFYPATIRLITHGQHDLDGKVLMPYDHLLTGIGSFKLGTAVDVETEKNGGGAVVLEGGEKVKYDILVLAPGSAWEGPVSFPNTEAAATEWISQWREKIAAAKNIVLVGAGAVGTELAGEIKDEYPDTKVTIVHGDSMPLNGTYTDRYRRRIEQGLRNRGVDFVFGDHVDAIPDTKVTRIKTRNGKSIAADLVISTHGSRPNTKFLNSLGEDILTATGRVKVEDTLQLPEHPDIFALGDVIEWPEQKQAAKTAGHAGIVVANVLSALERKKPQSVYKGSTEMILVTNGKNGGAMYIGILWGWVFGNWISSLLKSKNLMIPMARKAMGLLL